MTIRPTDPQRAATSIETKSELMSDIKRGTRLGYVIWTASRDPDPPSRMPRRRGARHARFPLCDSDKKQGRRGVMPFTKRAPRLIESRAASESSAPSRDTHQYQARSAALGHITSWRALSRPQTQNSLHFFAGWIQRDANTCATIFCARRLRLRRAVQLRQGGSVKRKRRRMSPDYSPGTQTADWQAQRTAILFNENYYRGIRRKTRRRRLILAGVGAAALIAVLAWAMKPAGQTGGGRGGFARGAGGGGPVPVRAVAATTGTVDVTVDALGTVAALNTATIHSRVDGPLLKVPFREGQLVKGGDLLAQIDPSTFQAALAQAAG